MVEKKFERYSRQIILPQFGQSGQERLMKSSVLVVGAGGLGSPVLAYLASAGVGTIGIIDGDRVDESNLQRQIIHFEHAVGKLKVKSASEYMKNLNTNINVIEHPVFLTSDNAIEIIDQYELVINGTDNFPTRYLVNDCCVLLKKPLIDASVLKFEGQATAFLPGEGCYRCIYPTVSDQAKIPNCSEVGVLGPIVGIMGSLQAAEALKILLGMKSSLVGKLALFDLEHGDFRSIAWKKNPNCVVCGENPTITNLNTDYGISCSAELETSDAWNLDFDAVKGMSPPPTIIDLRDTANIPIPFSFPKTLKLSYEEVLSTYMTWNKDERIIFICEIGMRSSAITEMLRLKGYTKIYHLANGALNW
jgi:molybdopterin/thiamine biosynthesis adenylyltransferase/rhodanese-related sulfurtransferase